MRKLAIWCCLLGFLGCLPSAELLAADKLRIAIPQRGAFGSSFTIPILAHEDGLFARYGIDPEFVYTRGGAETVQAVVSGSVDIAHGVGILSVFAAYEKGAPIRIIAAEQTGADILWYVDAAGPVKSLEQLAGKRVGYTRPGSSSHLVALEIFGKLTPPVELVSCGGVPDCHTMFTTGQLEAGWTIPPFLFEQVSSGQLRIIARGADVAAMQDQTIRVIVANARFLEGNPDLVERHLKLHEEALDRLYSEPERTLPRYAAYAGLSQQSANLMPEFFPRAAMRLSPVGNIELSQRQAVEHGFLRKALTDAQLKELLAARASIPR